ncbi:MAG: cytochrome c/FTR1 family iron permease [Bacteriovoracaceae bacterium]
MKIFNILTISLFLFSVAVKGQTPSGTKTDPRLVINLLDYISADYAGAVSVEGEVLSPSEYNEQKEFVQTTLDSAKLLPEVKNNQDILAKIEKLKKLVNSKDKPQLVAEIAQSAKRDVINVTSIAIAPTSWPSLENGKKLFAQNCVSCHGSNGNGDGAAGKNLDPVPANFHAEAMANNSPFKEFNVIRVGVPGTGMIGWDKFSDKEAWDLAFYVVSFRFQNKKMKPSSQFSDSELHEAATMSDLELLEKMQGTESEKNENLTSLRLYQGNGKETIVQGKNFDIARNYLQLASVDFKAGHFADAKMNALRAYLEGIEPHEPKLRANNLAFVAELEVGMSAVRSAIENQIPFPQFESKINEANTLLNRADILTTEHANSPLVTFFLSSGILLREGFEAVLIIIALLSILRATKASGAAKWVHAGWLSALALGLIAWIFSGWLLKLSGAGRELMEGTISIIAVVVLLYMGFWLHSKTEISRWTQFINERVKQMVEQKNHFGLLAIAFMAVFREAFETVLFLRAIWLDGGVDTKSAMGAGVAVSLLIIITSAWLILKFSAKLPLKKIFTVCSITMILLAVILAGKGIHALQEIGLFSITSLGSLRIETLGIFATKETLLAQFVILLLSSFLWTIGKQPKKIAA